MFFHAGAEEHVGRFREEFGDFAGAALGEEFTAVGGDDRKTLGSVYG